MVYTLIMIRTKIICTIGPSVNTAEKISELIDAGMNVARLNFSHGTHQDHLKVINLLKEAREKKGCPLAIMLDIKGPKIRLGKIQNDQAYLNAGQKWLLSYETVEGDSEKVSIDPAYILKDLQVGVRVLFDDGFIGSKVVEINSQGVVVQLENSGYVRTRKGVNIPNVSLSLPGVTEKDIEDLRFGCENDIDIVAASYVRSPRHVMEVRKILQDAGKSNILILTKIENHEGVENFDAILQVADGVMIARGDLGVEVPLSQVPRLQKMMIRKCYLAGRISVTATQMLESMINNPRPTRAEASDVANAIYDSTSAVMLSGETAVGKYPIETVNVMRTIIEESEKDFDYRSFFGLHSNLVYHDVPSAVTLACVKTAYSAGAGCVLASTTSGTTARLVARLRPNIPIIALTPVKKTYHQLAASWGVTPYLCEKVDNSIDAFAKMSAFALSRNLVSYGDLAVVMTGSPFGLAGTTNTLIVESIGNVLVRGHYGSGDSISGEVMFILDPKADDTLSCTGKIIVITQCNEKYTPFINDALGIILQNQMDDLESELYLIELAKELNKPILVRADDALHMLKEGGRITLDPSKALVYKATKGP